jgi:hypothetical protein
MQTCTDSPVLFRACLRWVWVSSHQQYDGEYCARPAYRPPFEDCEAFLHLSPYTVEGLHSGQRMLKVRGAHQ